MRSSLIRLTACATVLLIFLHVLALAGQFNPDQNIGDQAPAWVDLPGVDGKTHSLSDLQDAKAVVVVFTCNSCPYAVDAEDRLIALYKICKDKDAALVAINVNKVEEDLMPAMIEKSKEKKYQFPYLFDESQQIAKKFGARYTPEFFILNKDRKIAYMGSLDDSPNGKAVTKTYAQDALNAVLAGKNPAVKETVPIGCRIRFDRVRRTRRQASKP